MSTAPAADYDEVFTLIRAWPPGRRLKLAEAILDSLHQDLGTPPLRGVPVEKVLGVAAGSGPPPDDETVKRWTDEHRREKHG
jgi:hypothetical protein